MAATLNRTFALTLARSVLDRGPAYINDKAAVVLAEAVIAMDEEIKRLERIEAMAQACDNSQGSAITNNSHA